MDNGIDPQKSDAFITAAVGRKFITVAQADTLRRETAERSLSPSQLAVENGMMKPVEVEISEAFATPNELAPGYKLIDVLGFGALGVVYRAHQPHLKRDVAIKAILQSRLNEQNVAARFHQEGAAIGRLHHPNIVSAFDSGSHRARLFLVMELVRGTDLRERLDNEGAMNVATALLILRQCASGLAHALAHQIIHRDIKPGNLILTQAPAGYELPDGVPLVKIADFGLARLNASADKDEATQLTLTGAALGTPMYCAPEQLSGDPVDHRADMYALGATLVNMLTGQPPFEETKISKLIAAKLTGHSFDSSKLPNDLPDSIRSIIQRLMAQDPDERYDSYEQLIEDIDSILGTHKTPQSVDEIPLVTGDAEPPAQTRGWTRIAFLVGALSLVLVTAAVVLPRLFTSPMPSLQPTSWEEPLFDGMNVGSWKSRGLWSRTFDSEGGVILVCSGSALRNNWPIPKSESDGIPSAVAMRIGINLFESDSVELHFGFPLNDSPRVDQDDLDVHPRLVVRVDKTNVVLGCRESMDSKFQPTGEPVAPPSPFDSETPIYHEVKIEYHAPHWFAYFDDKPLGSAKAIDNRAPHLVQIITQNGKAHIEAPTTYGLRPI